jgi:hypothetical protein
LFSWVQFNSHDVSKESPVVFYISLDHAIGHLEVTLVGHVLAFEQFALTNALRSLAEIQVFFEYLNREIGLLCGETYEIQKVRIL